MIFIHCTRLLHPNCENSAKFQPDTLSNLETRMPQGWERNTTIGDTQHYSEICQSSLKCQFLPTLEVSMSSVLQETFYDKTVFILPNLCRTTCGKVYAFKKGFTKPLQCLRCCCFFEQPHMRIYHCYQISLRLRISVRYQFTTYLPNKNLTFPNRFVRHHFGWPVYKNSGALIGRICLLAMYFNFGFFTFLHNVVGSISDDWQLPWRIQLIRQLLLHF